MFRGRQSQKTVIVHEFKGARYVDHNWDTQFIGCHGSRSRKEVANHYVGLNIPECLRQKRSPDVHCFLSLIDHHVPGHPVLRENLVFAADSVEDLRRFTLLVVIVIADKPHIMASLNKRIC